VREAITFEFRGRHRGVYRTIPVRYIRGGFEYALRLDRVNVYDEGLKPLRTEVARVGDYLRVKAWVPGAENATRTVIFSYRVRRALFTVDDHPELYWNVTGNEWEVPIRSVEVVVASPAAVPPDALRAGAYTGYRGQAGTDYSEERAEQFLTFRATRPLGPREGLAVAVAWPPGAIAPPGLLREAAWFLGDNWPLALPFLTCAGALFAWRRFGRDPAMNRSIKPEYAPPRGLTPAEAGALVGERAEPRDVAATLVDLAVRGYLRVERVDVADADPDFRLRRLRLFAGDPDLKPFEAYLLGRLFGPGGGTETRLLSELRRDYDSVWAPVRDRIYASAAGSGLFAISPERVRGAWLAVGLVVAAGAGVLLAMGADRFTGGGVQLALGVGLSGLALAASSPLMPRKTWRGARVLVHVRGFQEFLERAEKDRLARMPGDTLHRFLPWAIALGVAERWVLNFEGVRVDPPAWMTGGDVSSPGSYHRAVSAFSSRTQQAFLTGRRGGGGFSGGSSGGGMGGGGGGTF
jgi:hypothetical protein